MKLTSCIVAFGLLTVSTACGSRSALLVAEASGGAGASSGGTSSGGSGGSGGSATGGFGGEVPCVQLVQKDPIVTLPPSPGPVVFDDYLRLVQLNGGSEVASVFSRAFDAKSPGIAHATFFPWTDWPATGSIAPVFTTGLSVGGVHYVTPAQDGGYALTVRVNDNAVVMPSINPHADGSGSGPPIALDGIDAEFISSRPAALGEPAYFAGTFLSSPSSILGRVVSSKGPVGSTQTLACAAQQSPRGAAVPYGNGWLIAVSSGSAFGGACTPSDPTHIDIVFADATGAMSLVTSIAANDAVVNVDAAPHSDGIYVVWSSSFDGIIRGARVSASGAKLIGPVAIVTNPSSNEFALATLGKQLAVAHRVNGNLQISIRNENLDEIFLGVTGITAFTALTTALGSPDGASVLVGYTTGPSPFSVHIARFDCEKGT